MKAQRGFFSLSPLLIAGIVGAALLATVAVQTWRLGRAQEALGAYQARTMQLEADVEEQARTLADERRDRERVDALLAATAADAAASRRRVAAADARYRSAKNESEAALAWAVTRQPDAALDRMCDDEPRGDQSGAGAGAATFCIAYRAPAAAAAGPAER